MANTKVKAEAASAAPATEIPGTIPEIAESAPAKKTRVKKVIRTIEELHETAAKKMTPEETVKYIDYMRDECTQLQEQLRSMTLNAQASYQQAARANSALESFKRKASAELTFAKQAVSTCYASVLRCEVPNTADMACACQSNVKEG
jgi:hypothetical protein